MGWIELGLIGAPFGIKGWTHVVSHTDPPEGLLDYPRWVLRLGNGERVTRKLLDGRTHGDGLVALLEGVEDRNAAAALTGATVEVDRSELPPTGDREYYRADLVGLKVENLEGVDLGTVAYFVDAPAGPLMVVRADGGREHWILATPQYLRKVDLAAGRIRVDWPVELE